MKNSDISTFFFRNDSFAREHIFNFPPLFSVSNADIESLIQASIALRNPVKIPRSQSTGLLSGVPKKKKGKKKKKKRVNQQNTVAFTEASPLYTECKFDFPQVQTCELGDFLEECKEPRGHGNVTEWV